ncbi:hypothetical protein ES703_50315 [subsurface metagenome]
MGYPPQGAAGVSEFIKLKDTAATYTGQKGKFPQVNPAETALAFAAGGLSVWTRVFNGALDTPTATVWSYGCDLPLPKRSASQVGACGGKIYSIGGYKANGSSTMYDNDAYDPASDTWASKADCPVQVKEFGAEGVSGVLYLIRGADNIYSYSPATNTYADKGVAPTLTAMSGGSCVTGGLVYFITYSAAFPNNYCRMTYYDPVLNSCTDRAIDGTHKHADHALETIPGYIFLISGSNNPADNCRYDIAGNTWLGRASPPSGHRLPRIGVASIGGIIYIFGGGDTATNKCSAYDNGPNTWQTKEVMPVNRSNYHSATATLDEKGWLVGGFSAFSIDTGTTTLLIFTPAQSYLLWSGTLNMGDAVAVYRPGGQTTIYSDGKIYNLWGSGCVFPIFKAGSPVRVQIPYTDPWADIEVYIGEVA